MAMIYYPAIIERAKRGYGVFFPEVPRCTSAGKTIDEAAYNAEKALSDHLLTTIEHGEDLPKPSSVDAIPRDPDVDEVVRMLVRAEKPGYTARLNITLDEGLIAAIDRVAENRSAL